MSKKLLVAAPLLAVALGALTPLRAQQSSPPPPPDQDAFVGKWQANRDKSRPKLGKRDASYTRTISRDGDDRLVSSGMTIPKPSSHEYRIRCDGQVHPVPSGSLSCAYKGTNLVEGESISPPPMEHLYWSEEVSQDRQVMKIFSYKDKQRTKIASIEVLDRVK
jgi:hypothetical protein